MCIRDRVVSFLALFFLLRRFSATYRSMLHQINHSWGILCIIPIVSFAATLYGVNRLNIANSLSAWFPIARLLIVCGCSYYLMYRLSLIHIWDRRPLPER